MIELVGDEYRGTVRDFLNFFQQPSARQRMERLGAIRVNLRHSYYRSGGYRIDEETTRQLVAVFKNATNRRLLTIEKIIFKYHGHFLAIDGGTSNQICRLFENLPLTASKVHLDFRERIVSMKANTSFEVEKSTRWIRSLATNSHLKELSLHGLDIRVEGARVVANDLIRGKPLEVLDVGAFYHGLDRQEASTIMRAALNGEISRIRSLKMADCAITDLESEVIAMLKTNTRLQILNLSENDFSDNDFQNGAEVIALIAAALTVNRSLTQLVLSNSYIYDDGCAALGNALKVNQSLMKLNLSSNYIGDDGCAALGNALKVNQSLMALDLSCNTIGDEGVRSLALGLRINRSLEHIDIHWCNAITERGDQYLVELVQRYNMRTTLKVRLSEGFSRLESLIKGAGEFNHRFIDSCRRLIKSNERPAATTTTADGENRDEEIRRFHLPLLGSTHALVKPTILFLLARRCPDDAARALAKTRTLETTAVGPEEEKGGKQPSENAVAVTGAVPPVIAAEAAAFPPCGTSQESQAKKKRKCEHELDRK